MAPKRTYGAEAKITTMMLALTVGVAAAAKQREIPRNTIYEWFKEGGGFEHIRVVADAAMIHAGLEARQSVYEAVKSRVEDMPIGELMTTFREMLKAEATALGASEAATGAQAGATAIGALHVHVDGEEIIVPREDHE